MRPVKPRIKPIELLGKNHHIPVVGLCDKGDSFYLNEVLRCGESDPHTISRVGAVCDEILARPTRVTRGSSTPNSS